jgi:hypothetical protein
MKMTSVSIAIIGLLATASLTAAASGANSAAAPNCKAIFKQYPVAAKCHGNPLCNQKNAENRIARKTAGCPVSSHDK